MYTKLQPILHRTLPKCACSCLTFFGHTELQLILQACSTNSILLNKVSECGNMLLCKLFHWLPCHSQHQYSTEKLDHYTTQTQRIICTMLTDIHSTMGRFFCQLSSHKMLSVGLKKYPHVQYLCQLVASIPAVSSPHMEKINSHS